MHWIGEGRMPSRQPARCWRYIISRRCESQMKVPNIQKIPLKGYRDSCGRIDEDNRNAVHERGWPHSLVIGKSAAVSSRVEVTLGEGVSRESH
jgi:hypothetical protein